MSFAINRVVVIGSGTMGGGIAAHCANVGIPVYLLDIAPKNLAAAEEKKNLSLDSPQVKNRIVTEALERLKKLTPAPFFTAATANLITVGNLDDHFDFVAEGDWIVEAIVEDLQVKRDLVARIDAVRKPDSIVSSNTSGIPIADIAAECSADFKAHFLGTHFFNPPRYMKLLEVIPTADTKPEVVDFISDFCEGRLGKGVVLCKDTPNFIANRYNAISGSMALNYILDNDYTVEEVDTITGPLIGQPKTASFRLMDLVGIDVAYFVGRNLYDLLEGDESRDVLLDEKRNKLIGGLVEKGFLGDKTGGGFYKKPPRGTKGAIQTIDLNTLEYRERIEPDIPSLAEAAKIKDLTERVKFIIAQDDKAGKLVRVALHSALAYISRHVPEIADDVLSVDNAIRWGFANQTGPFETWDALGVRQTVEAIEKEGLVVGDWVKEMLANGNETFYKTENGVLSHYVPAKKDYVVEKSNPHVVKLANLKANGNTIATNQSASLVDLGDGVFCIEFHSKMNTIDENFGEIFVRGLEETDKRGVGLVIGNQGQDFCVGANVAGIAQIIRDKEFEKLDFGLKRGHELFQAIRYFHKPVVTAPFGRTLGGGCEISMSGTRMAILGETYMGLVEVGVGLIPGGGGCLALLQRIVSSQMDANGTLDAVPFLRKAFHTIALAKVSSSAADARELGFVTDNDRIVMSRDRQIAAAKQMVLEMAENYTAPIRQQAFAAGRDSLAALQAEAFIMQQSGWASEYDGHLANKVAYILCGGNLSAGQWVDEQHILDLEREAFVSLCGEQKTLDRIEFMLANGKPLRN